MGLIQGFIQKKAIEWFAKQLGITPQLLQSVLDDVVAFIREIFNSLSPDEQKVFFRQGATALQNAQPVRVKQILTSIKEAAKK